MKLHDQALRITLTAGAMLALIGCGAQSSASVSVGASIAPPAASETPAATATATPMATAIDAPQPSPTGAYPTPAPGAQRTPFLPFGQWATVTGDGLRIRAQADLGSQDEVIATVNAGEALFNIGAGAVSYDGYDWHWVAYGAGVGGDGYVHAVGSGYVAGASSDGDEEFVALADPECPPATVDAATLGGLTGWTIAHCDVGPLIGFEGMLNQPIHGPLTPFSYEPTWLWFPQWFLTEPDEAARAFMWSGWSIGLHFPPGMDSSALRRGDLVRLDGHLDDPAASECRIIGSGEEGGPVPSDGDQQAFRQGCSVAFVVDTIEVTGHIDLEE